MDADALDVVPGLEAVPEAAQVLPPGRGRRRKRCATCVVAVGLIVFSNADGRPKAFLPASTFWASLRSFMPARSTALM
jgi:hypothetical protein